MRVWFPPKQVVFGPRDTQASGYDRARSAGEEHGFPPNERSVGGRAVAYTGQTLAFTQVDPVANERRGITERYERTTSQLIRALGEIGVSVERGEPDGAFCPGSHSLSADGKIAGIAQRIGDEVAVTAGIVVICDRAELVRVLEPVYENLKVEFDPQAVGSIHRAGSIVALETVASVIEDALLDGRHPKTEDVRKYRSDQ
ncbi:lipoate--protein ligase family protein [Natrinema sp. DC36]|uniref:lipoyl protein ligase domain-containing protein n=1 Tax=Natrinema sp. DC36 TaxID=2878680 RepID=UPI001CEFDE2A|nr:lipoate--protein ligase family protein [Natrinema sp. DC36]